MTTICTNCRPLIGTDEMQLCSPCEQEYQERWAPLEVSKGLYFAARAVVTLSTIPPPLLVKFGIAPQDLEGFHPWLRGRIHPEAGVVGSGYVLGLEPEEAASLPLSRRYDTVMRSYCMRKLLGVQEYSCNWSLALGYAYYGIPPTAAEHFERLLTTFVPITNVERDIRQYHLDSTHWSYYLGSDLAYEWAEFFQVGREYTTAAELAEEHYPRLLRPSSILGYVRAGVPKSEVSQWHRLVARDFYGQLGRHSSERMIPAEGVSALLKGMSLEGAESGGWVSMADSEKWRSPYEAGFQSVSQWREWRGLISSLANARGITPDAATTVAGRLAAQGIPLEWARAYLSQAQG